MHSLPCSCGNTILVDPLSENAGYLIWDCDVDQSIGSRRKELDGFFAAIASGQRDAWLRYFYGTSAAASRWADKTDTDIVEDILSKHDRYTRSCYRCPDCGRLYIELQPGTGGFRGYTVDE